MHILCYLIWSNKNYAVWMDLWLPLNNSIMQKLIISNYHMLAFCSELDTCKLYYCISLRQPLTKM